MASSSGSARFPEIETGLFSLRQARNSGPTLIFVWRTDCPTCQLTLPFFDRIAKRFRTVTVVGFAQDTQEAADAYLKSQGLSLRNFSDVGLSVSGLLRVGTVPAYWLLNKHGEVVIEGNGWNRDLMEKITLQLSADTSQAYAPLVTAADQVPVLKPG